MAKQITWIGEKEAAEMVGLSPKYFRRKVQKLDIPVNYTQPSRNHFEYNAADIEAYKMQTAFKKTA